MGAGGEPDAANRHLRYTRARFHLFRALNFQLVALQIRLISYRRPGKLITRPVPYRGRTSPAGAPASLTCPDARSSPTSPPLRLLRYPYTLRHDVATKVLGAAGATGLECVKRLLAVSDLPTRAVVRDPAKLEGAIDPNPKLQIARGDVADEASLREALRGAKGVIFAAAGKGYWSAAEVDFKGVASTARVARELGAERVVLVSSMLVTRKHWLHPVRIILNNIRWGLMDNKLKGEDALRASGVPYTIVRPGGLGRGPGGRAAIATGQGDVMPMGSINRADVAAVCVAALTAPAAANVTLEVVARPPGAPAAAGGAGGSEGGYEAQLRDMWAGLKPDAQA